MNEFPVCSVQKQEKAISKSVPTGHENCHYYGIYRTIKVWRYVTKNMQVRLTALYIENFTLWSCLQIWDYLRSKERFSKNVKELLFLRLAWLVLDSFQSASAFSRDVSGSGYQSSGRDKGSGRPGSLSWLCHLFCVVSGKSLIPPPPRVSWSPSVPWGYECHLVCSLPRVLVRTQIVNMGKCLRNVVSGSCGDNSCVHFTYIIELSSCCN